MSNRIIQSNLDALVLRINREMKQPEQPYAKDETTGRYIAQIGNYHISGAYGGVQLHQMVNAGGGVRSVLNTGYCTKRKLWDAMQAFLSGIYAERDVSGE